MPLRPRARLGASQDGGKAMSIAFPPGRDRGHFGRTEPTEESSTITVRWPAIAALRRCTLIKGPPRRLHFGRTGRTKLDCKKTAVTERGPFGSREELDPTCGLRLNYELAPGSHFDARSFRAESLSAADCDAVPRLEALPELRAQHHQFPARMPAGTNAVRFLLPAGRQPGDAGA
jgi:hypothetical protein